MSISSARRLAFEVLRRVETENAYAADVLHARLSATGKATIRPDDAALATELVFGVLRWQRRLDFLVDCHLRSKSPLDPEVRIALRLGAYQLQFLTRVPARAAVHESVELTKAAGKGSAAGLVNAVLRRPELAQLRGDLGALFAPGVSAVERLAIAHSHPTWLVERWLARWGEASTEALLAANNATPALVCTVADPAQREPTLEATQRAGVKFEAGRWLREALAITGGARQMGRFVRSGAVLVQDEASQMVAHLLEVQPGQRVLDLCAAPGGKTIALARALGANGEVVAADLHLHRLRAMRERPMPASGARMQLVTLDGTRPLPFAARFSRILVDAPCSGTGTLARNPEIRWRLEPRDLPDLHARQTQLLTHALDQLVPGGRLVYSTCSLELEENEDVLAAVLTNRTDVRVTNGASSLARALRDSADAAQLFDSAGYFRTFPHEHHTDGFFAAVLEKC